MSFLFYGVFIDPHVHTFEYFQRDDVCRFCWKNETRHIHYDLFTADTMEKIIECIDIDLSRYDRPNKVCVECKELIENFYKFKKLCQESDQKLCEILSNCHESKPVNNTDTDIEKDHVDSKDTDGDFDFFDCLKSEPEVLRGKESEAEHKPKPTYLRKSKRTATYCNICRLDLENVENFDSHNSKCHGIEKTGQYKCFGCEKLFKNRKTRLGHELNFCKGLKDGYKCDVCGRFLPRRGMYEAHMRDHRTNVEINLPEELFKCQKCDLLFKTKKLLDEHIVGHKSDMKKYVCESCGRVFTRVDYLLKHKMTHTGEKQHECPHCGFRTTQRSSLTMHIRRHTGERPYRCNVCPQRCISSSNLRAHQQRHLGIKMHECKICNKKFGYKVSLQEHMSTHAPAQTHACDQCTASYSRLRALKRHIATKHLEKMTGE